MKIINPKLEVLDWGLLNFEQAFDLQKAFVEQRLKGQIPDRLILVEHPAVVTIGASGNMVCKK